MKLRKVLSALLLLALAFAPAAWAAGQAEVAPLSPEFLEWRGRGAASDGPATATIAADDEEEFYGLVPEPVDWSHLSANPPVEEEPPHMLGAPAMDQDTTPPSKYDLRSDKSDTWVTPVKNQGSYGTCWAHAALGGVESNYLGEQGGTALDLSELHMAWFTYQGDAGKAFGLYDSSKSVLNQGGNAAESIALMSRLDGPTLEAELPYTGAASVATTTSGKKLGDYPLALRLTAAYRLGEVNDSSRELVKQLIMKHGGVQVSYYSAQTTATDGGGKTGNYTGSGNKFCYYAKDYRANGGKTTTNHAVLVVGWDDDFAASNFSSNPGKNGAWLVKNSWGTDWGNGGYFWMSYEQYITNGTVYVAEAVGDEELTQYGYDDLGQIGSTSHTWAANVFKAGSGEALRRVGFSTPDNNEKYEIYVYDLGTDAPSSPVSSTRLSTAAISGTEPYAGYHTVDLDDIDLPSDHYFSVVMKMTSTSGYAFPTAAERSLNWGNGKTYADPVINEGESYFYYGGGSSVPTSGWEDGKTLTFASGVIPMNACIKAFTVESDPEAFKITTNSLPNGTLNAAYSAELKAKNADGDVTWSVEGLPEGLALDETTGAITGTPTEAGTASLTVTATDAGDNEATKTLKLTIDDPSGSGSSSSEENDDEEDNKPVITTTNLPDGQVGTAYSATVTATGPGTITWAKGSGNLPDGLIFSEGKLSGKPTKAGMFTFTVNASNSAGTASKEFTITIAADPNAPKVPTITGTLPDGQVGTAYSASLSATGGGTIAWSVTSGTLPSGLTFSDGKLSGKPTKAGSYTFTVKASNTAGSATKECTVTIAADPNAPKTPVISGTLPSGKVGTAYSASLSATGGGVITWSVSSGTLPTGLTFSGGTLSGKPTKAGTYSFTAKAANTAGSATKAYSVTIAAAANSPTTPVISGTFPKGAVKAAYSASLSATGGGTIVWSKTSGTLPAGLVFSGGTLSGKPTKVGNYTFTVKAANNAGSATRSFTVTIAKAGTKLASLASVEEANEGRAEMSALDGGYRVDDELRANPGGDMTVGLSPWTDAEGNILNVANQTVWADGSETDIMVNEDGTLVLPESLFDEGGVDLSVTAEAGGQTLRSETLYASLEETASVAAESGASRGCDAGFGALGLALASLLLVRRK